MPRSLRDALRQVRHQPLLTLVAVVTLAIGIGASATFFTLLNALVFRPLPVPRADRLVFVSARDADGNPRGFSKAMVAALSERQRAFSAMAGYLGGGPVHVQVGGDRFSAGIEVADGSYFATLAVPPLLGRFLTATDDRAANVVVGTTFWQRHLDSDPAAVGRSLRIEGVTFTVVGVAPPAASGLQVESPADLIILDTAYPAVLGLPASDTVPLRGVIGRLDEHATLAGARSAIAALWPSVLAAGVSPESSDAQRSALLTRRVSVEAASTGFSFLRPRYGDGLRLLMALAVLMLVVTCVNLASVLVAGTLRRQHEFRIRTALGASRGHLARQLTIEGALLVVAGMAAGLVVAVGASPRLLAALWPTMAGIPVSLAPDWRVFAGSAALFLLTVTVAAAIPASLAGRRASGPAPGVRGAITTGSRWERALLVAQMAAAIVLVAGAGMFGRTLIDLRAAPLGFEVDDLHQLTLAPVPGLPADADDVRHARDLAVALVGVPGVEAVGFIDHGLMLGAASQTHRSVAPAGSPDDGHGVGAMVEYVSPGFFRTVGIPLERGRDLGWEDGPRTPRVAVITATAGRTLFPQGNAIGRRIRVGTEQDERDVEVVGVVADSRLEDLHVPASATVFLSLGQRPGALRWSFLQVRTAPGRTDALDAVRARIDDLGRQSVDRIGSARDFVDIALTRERLAAALGLVFAALAIGLTALGTYALLSRRVARRRKELGVRLALGAAPAALRRSIVGEGVTLALAGVAIGIPVSLGVARLARAADPLFAPAGLDPLVLSTAAGVLVLVAVAATFAPARRASRVDPLAALRSE